MKKLGIILPLLAIVAASPAYAQGVGLSVRAEARVGYDEVRPRLTVQNNAITGDYGASDAMFGAEIGVDAHISRVQVGVYGGLESSTVDECVDRPFRQIASARRDIACIEASRNFTAGVRVGLSVGGEGLIYVKGGYSSGTFSASYNATAATPATRLFEGEQTQNGYHVGGGFELNFSRSFYGKAEYVQHSYDDAFDSSLPTGSSFEPRRRQLVVGVGFRFGGR